MHSAIANPFSGPRFISWGQVWKISFSFFGLPGKTPLQRTKFSRPDPIAFGSAASGEAGPESDVDFLVEVGQLHSSWFPAGLVADLEDLLGHPVDVVTADALHWYIRDRVLKEAVPL